MPLLSAEPGRRAAQLDHVSRLSGVTCLQWAEVRQVSTNAGRCAGGVAPAAHSLWRVNFQEISN